MKPAVLFDLGNTLAAYYDASDFQPILESAISNLLSELRHLDLARVPLDAAFASAIAENEEAPDFRVTPLAERLERIFEIPLTPEGPLARRLCESFLKPIFATGRVYEDSVPVIEALRGAGHPVAIVSNAPWGSPPSLWRRELQRLGLAQAVDGVVLCGDVGWRKPAREIFEYSAILLERRPKECIFVGDDLHWDISGSDAVGMRPIVIDRKCRHQDYAGERIENLRQLLAIVEARA